MLAPARRWWCRAPLADGHILLHNRGGPSELVHAVKEERHEHQARAEAHAAVQAGVDVVLEEEHKLDEEEHCAPHKERHWHAH